MTKPIQVIHNFFDGERFKPHSKQCVRSEFANDGEALLGHVSNFRPVKRTMDVIDTFERITREMPARLVLIGEGPDTVLARRQVMKRGLKDKVKFLGNQSRVEAVLPCLDVFLMPSEEESFGLAALEALACGVPVIGTRGTGLVEVIDDGRTGVLCDVGDTTAMAAAAIDLLRNGERLLKFKQAASDWAKDNFSAEKIIDEYEAYYHKVCNGQAG
jgi:N-acetyl-alpha-D-glucosaminyl L-malate synthase BshA